MPSDAVILPVVVARVRTMLGDNIAGPVPADEPTELEFLDIMSSFHMGWHPCPDVPRTREIYKETLSEYVGILVTLNTVLLNTDFHMEAGRRVYDFDETVGRFILDLLLIDDDDYPVRNLIYKIWTSIALIDSHPTPIYQTKFLVDLPKKAILLVLQHLEDLPAYRFTRTCRRYYELREPRMYQTAYFRMRYRNYVIQGVTEIDTNTLYMDVLHAMVNSRAHAVSSVTDYMGKSEWTPYVRTISFDNEWPRMWPRHVSKSALLQEGTSSEIFDPLYGAVCVAVRDLKIEHLRLVSLALHPRVTHVISNSQTLKRLTVERTIATFQIADFAFHMLRKLRNITHLNLGFGPDAYAHARVWTAFALCQCVQHVYAFADPITRVGLEYPFYSQEIAHLHTVDTLHVHGSTPRLDNLLYWLGAAGAARRAPGALRRIKVHTYGSISGDDAYWIVSVLGRYHRDLRILVLDGIETVHPRLFGHVRDSLPKLEALCIVRRISQNMHDTRLVSWSHPAYQYAEALHGHQTLRHIEVNMLWDFNARVLGSAFDDDTPSLSDASSSSDMSEEMDTTTEDREYDGIAMARTFASHLPMLQTFAIRNDVTFFSCAVGMACDAGPPMSDIQANYPGFRFENWNPRSGMTWVDT